MRDTLRKEANTVIQQDNVDKWIGEGMPTALTRGVLNKIMEELIERGYAGAGAQAETRMHGMVLTSMPNRH